jgi:hypothetical protein
MTVVRSYQCPIFDRQRHVGRCEFRVLSLRRKRDPVGGRSVLEFDDYVFFDMHNSRVLSLQVVDRVVARARDAHQRRGVLLAAGLLRIQGALLPKLRDALCVEVRLQFEHPDAPQQLHVTWRIARMIDVRRPEGHLFWCEGASLHSLLATYHRTKQKKIHHPDLAGNAEEMQKLERETAT